MSDKSKYHIVIPAGMKPRSKLHEETAAEIIAEYLKCDVHFIITGSHGTLDIIANNIKWEMKSPIGTGANNIQKNMREASAQSENIIIDLRRSRLHQRRAMGYIFQFTEKYKKLKRVLVITKSGTVWTFR